MEYFAPGDYTHQDVPTKIQTSVPNDRYQRIESTAWFIHTLLIVNFPVNQWYTITAVNHNVCRSKNVDKHLFFFFQYNHNSLHEISIGVGGG